MKKSKDIIGAQAYDAHSGGRIGVISAVLYNINEPVWFIIETTDGREMAVFFEDLEIGVDNSIIIDSSKIRSVKDIDVTSLHKIPDDEPLPVITGEGRYVGRISDILLDVNKKRVDGVEISASLVDDIIKGRNILLLTGNEISDGKGMKIPEWEYNNVYEGGKGLKKLLGFQNSEKIRKE
ncbi:PRC-barrel domain-containing protein [Mahella australiensis]|uniref:PRC-barrel domain-containing protein n=1 Tax=Mahella australiensis (strain DSM 15567 / CIP 107919 / 50-1 BON) TaxID=697281 RepID=F4A1K1_MAHA5|nr:PRC-barrel domain-containing protein [Mahella australiensis]AEE96035.1 hypothetical protein Mahau_0837 [Mahella australiensis 50-1 BON]